MKGPTAPPVTPFPYGLHFYTTIDKSNSMILAMHCMSHSWKDPMLRLFYQDYIKRHSEELFLTAMSPSNLFSGYHLRSLRERGENVCKKHLLEIEENCQGNQQGCYRQSMANDRHIIKYERHLQFNKKKKKANMNNLQALMFFFLIEEESTKSTSHFVFLFFQRFFFNILLISAIY